MDPDGVLSEWPVHCRFIVQQRRGHVDEVKEREKQKMVQLKAQHEEMRKQLEAAEVLTLTCRLRTSKKRNRHSSKQIAAAYIKRIAKSMALARKARPSKKKTAKPDWK